MAEKILELAKIRPIFRFNILEHHITVEHLQAQLQFGKGQQFQVRGVRVNPPAYCYLFCAQRTNSLAEDASKLQNTEESYEHFI